MPAQYPSQTVLRRPLIGVALCCILGIACGVLGPGLAPRYLFLAAAASLVVSLAGNWAAYWAVRHLPLSVPPSHSPQPTVYSPSSVRLPLALSLFLLHLAILLTAWLNAALCLHNPSGRELALLMDRPREGVELVGVITDDPVMRSARDGKLRIWHFPLRVEMVRRLPSWQTARGTVQVSLRDSPGSQSPHYGQRWRLSGVLVDNARFPGPPSFAMTPYGLSRGASRPVLEWIKNRYTFVADQVSGICLAEDQGAPFMAWCFRGRRKAANCLARGIEHRPEVAGLLQALLLGYRQELTDKLRRDFIATGTYHIFAISGQHVAILALFIVVALQAQRVCRVKWFFYVAPVLIVFTLSTGLSASTVRGCLMALLVFLGPLLHRKPDLPSAMALAAILILAVAPFQLFDYGFLLSFGVVAGLIVFCPPMLKRLEPLLAPDPWRLEPERPVVQLGRNVARVVALLLVASLAAWVVSTPLIARWFNLVSPVALLANLVVIPVSAFVLLAGYFSILFGTWWPWLGEVFNFANVVLVSFLLFITDIMARISWGHFFVASPPIWALLVWFGTLVAWHPGWGLRRLWIVGPVLLVIALLGSVILNLNRVSADIHNVDAVPVCLIKASGTSPMLVHAGPCFHGRHVAQKLRQQGVNRLSALVLPVADEHHAGGAPDILAAFRVKELWCTTTNSRSRVFRQALEVARERSVPIRMLTNDAWSVWHGRMDVKYQAVSNEFLVRRGETVLRIGWHRQNVPETRSTLHAPRATRRGRAMLGQEIPLKNPGLTPREVTRPTGNGPFCRPVDPTGRVFQRNQQDDPDMVMVERHAPDGMPASTLHIRCVEPGEVAPEISGANGVSVIGLTPGQGLRVYLDESDCRVEPLENR